MQPHIFPLTEFDTWEGMAIKTYQTLKTFIHKAYGHTLTAIKLQNTSGQNGYGRDQNIYNILDGAKDTDNDMMTTVTQAAAAAAITDSTFGLAQVDRSIIISDEITAAIKQLLANQTAMMSQMAAMSFMPAPTQHTGRFVACKPFQVSPIQQLAIPTRQSFHAGGFNSGRLAKGGNQDRGWGRGGRGCNPFMDYVQNAGATLMTPGQGHAPATAQPFPLEHLQEIQHMERLFFVWV